MEEPLSAAFDDLQRRLVDELGFRIDGITALEGGGNNRLFRLNAVGREPLLAKFYYRDDRRQGEREFRILSFLRTRGFTNVRARISLVMSLPPLSIRLSLGRRCRPWRSLPM